MVTRNQNATQQSSSNLDPNTHAKDTLKQFKEFCRLFELRCNASSISWNKKKCSLRKGCFVSYHMFAGLIRLSNTFIHIRKF